MTDDPIIDAQQAEQDEARRLWEEATGWTVVRRTLQLPQGFVYPPTGNVIGERRGAVSTRQRADAGGRLTPWIWNHVFEVEHSGTGEPALLLMPSVDPNDSSVMARRMERELDEWCRQFGAVWEVPSEHGWWVPGCFAVLLRGRANRGVYSADEC